MSYSKTITSVAVRPQDGIESILCYYRSEPSASPTLCADRPFVGNMDATIKQDLPPKGGYRPINFTRNAAKSYIGGNIKVNMTYN